MAGCVAGQAGVAPEPGCELRIDATISIAFSEKENAAATWKKTFGFHPLLAFLDRRAEAAGAAPAPDGQTRPGRPSRLKIITAGWGRRRYSDL